MCLTICCIEMMCNADTQGLRYCDSWVQEHRLQTAEQAEAYYKKHEKKPAPAGWESFNQKTLFKAYDKRTKDIPVDLEVCPYPNPCSVPCDSTTGDACASAYKQNTSSRSRRPRLQIWPTDICIHFTAGVRENERSGPGVLPQR